MIQFLPLCYLKVTIYLQYQLGFISLGVEDILQIEGVPDDIEALIKLGLERVGCPHHLTSTYNR